MESGSIDLTSLAVNLGIAGTVIVLVIVVGYRIAIRLIRNWRESEKERTAELGVGLGKIADRIATIGDTVARVEGKLDGQRERHRVVTNPTGVPHLRAVDEGSEP